MVIKGKVHKMCDNVNTDIIIPARFCNKKSIDELKKGCMFDIIDHFHENVSKGDVIVAGKNFGCGSSREAAPLAIKATGIECIIAKSFARIFYRNSINIGLFLIETDRIYDLVDQGVSIEINIEEKYVDIEGKRISWNSSESDIVNEIIVAGGLIDYINKKLI